MRQYNMIYCGSVNIFIIYVQKKRTFYAGEAV